jgi:hypothetical protein
LDGQGPECPFDSGREDEMKRIVVIGALILFLFLVPNPVVPDEALAADDETEEGTLEEYVPSQQVSADASISFPVDI